KDTLRFGPFKPKGLTDPATGRRPFAVLQLRQDDKAGELWSLVGMQTRMKRHEQERIFRSLPGLENAEFVRYGSVHRNTFIDSPKFLQPWLEYRGRPGLFFAGQITGVEGYVESASGGLVAGINAARAVLGETPVVFPSETAIGSLMNYISDPSRTDFQPMNVSYGLIQSYTAPLETKKKTPKRDRRREYAEKALMIAEDFYQRVAPPALPSETFTCL
ncbi:MAG: methylenetetrahydrofolate--tRNA-(uracil(54)-C(5))-methyltransferase (FADH(2)-oxidizing) TrmFO, partial [Deltaproteobacteria bacterium]|nr:methylenetetrahydrofolate--tRNA-(uracil(54)-C(5))-methyltransferase (FADH(2)-oxidizing) TrmFO [Deltaproteobacteria bacterium]